MKSVVHLSQVTSSLTGLFAALIFTVVLTASAHAQPLPQADRDFIDTTTMQAMKDGDQPGVSIAVSGPQGDYSQAYGLGDRIQKTPLSTNDHFRVGSITKLFTAQEVLIQVDRGTIGLEDAISKYVPAIPNGNLITIRELLSMRSGLYDYTDDTLFRVLFALDPKMPFSPQNVLAIVRSHKPLFDPGTQYSYSNSNYIILGLILEKTTSTPVETLITNDIIKPLGLTETSFPTTAALPLSFSHGYGPNPLLSVLTKDYTAVNPDTTWTAGAIVSTTSDLTKYANGLRTGALVSPATQAQRLQFCAIPASGMVQRGYGLGLLGYGRWRGHNGSIPGFGSVLFYDPQSGTTITGMENTWRSNFLIYTDILPQIAEHLQPGSTTSQTYPTC